MSRDAMTEEEKEAGDLITQVTGKGHRLCYYFLKSIVPNWLCGL